MKIKLEHPQAKAPTKGSPFAAGFDLYCIERVEIRPGCQSVLPTGISGWLVCGCGDMYLPEPDEGKALREEGMCINCRAAEWAAHDARRKG